MNYSFFIVGGVEVLISEENSDFLDISGYGHATVNVSTVKRCKSRNTTMTPAPAVQGSTAIPAVQPQPCALQLSPLP